MSERVSKRDVSKLSRFLKDYDNNKKELKLKDISNFLTIGRTSQIISEDNFITKKGKVINAYANVIAYKDGTSKIRNIVISNTATQKELFELMVSCINFLKSKNCKTIELNADKRLEKIFKEMNFEKIGEKQNSIYMKYKTKHEIQSNLKKQFDDANIIEDISEKTSQQLRKLR